MLADFVDRSLGIGYIDGSLPLIGLLRDDRTSAVARRAAGMTRAAAAHGVEYVLSLGDDAMH